MEMKFQTKVFYLMGECKCKMREAIEALEKRYQNREWAEEYLKNKHKEGYYPEWVVYPLWYKKQTRWCHGEGYCELPDEGSRAES